MNRLATYLLIIMLFFGGATVSSADTEYAQYLPKWIELLKKGNAREKKLALHSLWFLEYGEFRKDKNVFDPILYTLLKDKDPSVRAAAADCLKRIGDYSKACCTDTKIVLTLIQSINDTDPNVRREVILALAYFKDERAIKAIASKLKDPDPWVKLNAAFSLGEIVPVKGESATSPLKTPDQWTISNAINPLLDVLNDDSDWRNKYVQQEVIIALRKIRKWSFLNDKAVVPVLISKAKDLYLRKEIIATLGELRAAEAREILLEATKDTDEVIRKLAVEALSKLPVLSRREQTNGREQSIDLFIKSLKDPSAEVRANAAKALGDIRDTKAIEPLIGALQDGDTNVKRKSVEALLNYRDDRIFSALAELIYSSDWMIRDLAEEKFRKLAEHTAAKKIDVKTADIGGGHATFFTNFEHPVAVTALLRALNKADEKAEASIIRLLGSFHDQRITEVIKKYLDNSSPEVRKWGVYSLARSAGEDVVPVLINKMEDKDPGVRQEAASSLLRFRDKRAIEPLIERLKDSNGSVRGAALSSLGNIDDLNIKGLDFDKLLKDENSSVKGAAINILRKKPDKRSVEYLIPLLNDPYFLVASGAARALGEIGDKRAIDPLIKALNGEYNRKRSLDGDLDLRKAAADALRLLEDDKSIPDLTKVALNQKEDIVLRFTAAKTMCVIGGSSEIEVIKSLIYEEKFHYKFELINALAKVNEDEALAICIEFLSSMEKSRVEATVNLLGRLKNNRAIKPLVKTAGENKIDKWNIIRVLKQYEDRSIPDTLIVFLKDNDPSVKKGAIILLGEFREKKAIDPLKSLLEDKDPDMRTLAKEALSKIEFVGTPQPRMMDGRGPMPFMRGDDAVFRTSTGFRIIRNGPGQPFEKMPRDRKEVKPEIVTAQQVKIVDIQPLIAKLKDKDANVRRETAEALGDSGNIKASEHLIPLLKDNDAFVRQAAARSLGKLKVQDAVSALIESTKDSDINVRSFSTWALGEIRDVKAIESLANLLLDKEEKIRDQSFDALRKYSNPVAQRAMVKKLIESSNSSASYILLSKLMSLEGDQVLFKALEDPDGNDAKTIRNYIELLERNIVSINDRQLPQKALSEYQNRELILSEISAFIKTKTDNVPYSTINFLGHLKDPKGLPILLDIVNTKRESDSKLAVFLTAGSRTAAVIALGNLGDKGASKTLLDILVNANESFAIRQNAAQALGKIGEEKAVTPLMEILKNSSVEKELRTGAASALGNLKDKKPVELLISILKDDSADLWFRVSAASALGEIGDERAIEPLSETIKNPKSHSYLIHAVEIALRKFKDKK